MTTLTSEYNSCFAKSSPFACADNATLLLCRMRLRFVPFLVRTRTREKKTMNKTGGWKSKRMPPGDVDPRSGDPPPVLHVATRRTRRRFAAAVQVGHQPKHANQAQAPHATQDGHDGLHRSPLRSSQCCRQHLLQWAHGVCQLTMRHMCVCVCIQYVQQRRVARPSVLWCQAFHVAFLLRVSVVLVPIHQY